MGSLERQAAAMSGIATDKPEAEARILWSAPEGQVTNAGVFLLALLLCWLVLPVAWALYCYLRTANHRYILRHLHPPEVSRTGVLRVFEQPVGKRVAHRRRHVP